MKTMPERATRMLPITVSSLIPLVLESKSVADGYAFWLFITLFDPGRSCCALIIFSSSRSAAAQSTPRLASRPASSTSLQASLRAPARIQRLVAGITSLPCPYSAPSCRRLFTFLPIFSASLQASLRVPARIQRLAADVTPRQEFRACILPSRPMGQSRHSPDSCAATVSG